MNELNLVSPVNKTSPLFMNMTVQDHTPTVKYLESCVGKLCKLESINSLRKSYTALQSLSEEDAVKELRNLKTFMKTSVSFGKEFVLLSVVVDDRKNILLHCLGVEPGGALVYWVPFYSRNMKLSVIAP